MSFLKFDYSILFIYLSGVILLATSVVFGSVIVSLIVCGILFLLLGLTSQTAFGIFKKAPVKITALIWVLLAITTSFLPYIFGYTENKAVLWISIGVSMTNLLALLFSKIALNKEE